MTISCHDNTILPAFHAFRPQFLEWTLSLRKSVESGEVLTGHTLGHTRVFSLVWKRARVFHMYENAHVLVNILLAGSVIENGSSECSWQRSKKTQRIKIVFFLCISWTNVAVVKMSELSTKPPRKCFYFGAPQTSSKCKFSKLIWPQIHRTLIFCWIFDEILCSRC